MPPWTTGALQRRQFPAWRPDVQRPHKSTSELLLGLALRPARRHRSISARSRHDEHYCFPSSHSLLCRTISAALPTTTRDRQHHVVSHYVRTRKTILSRLVVLVVLAHLIFSRICIGSQLINALNSKLPH